MKNTLKIILLLLVLFNFVGCGYTPSSKFARQTLGEKISTSVVISALDPENTVLIKDAVDSSLIQVFHSSLVDKNISDTHLVLKMSEPLYTPIIYDSNGYIIGYRMSITLFISRYHNGVSTKYTTRGNFDFKVAPNAVVTDKDRFDAIKVSAEKAIRAFIAQVSAEGARAKE
ncbi:MAG: hypothetical protein COB17_06280 [Sulfurimonas sp.]|nr:MAG: hypothetical protein COB17_06280 [Sulfurimonas sp.]